jgi:hypothetical protein
MNGAFLMKMIWNHINKMSSGVKSLLVIMKEVMISRVLATLDLMILLCGKLWREFGVISNAMWFGKSKMVEGLISS